MEKNEVEILKYYNLKPLTRYRYVNIEVLSYHYGRFRLNLSTAIILQSIKIGVQVSEDLSIQESDKLGNIGGKIRGNKILNLVNQNILS